MNVSAVAWVCEDYYVRVVLFLVPLHHWLTSRALLNDMCMFSVLGFWQQQQLPPARLYMYSILVRSRYNPAPIP